MIAPCASRSTNKTACSAKYHLIWGPNYRRRVLVGGVDARPEAIIARIVAEVTPSRNGRPRDAERHLGLS
jgi:hypothetical protein